jgi:hypothetical protein
MSKRLKTAAELVALLNAELCKQDACSGVSVDGVTPFADERVTYTWTATVLRRSSGPVPGQCSRFFIAAVRLLQQQYDLALEEYRDPWPRAELVRTPTPQPRFRSMYARIRDRSWSRTERVRPSARIEKWPPANRPPPRLRPG